jgi:hypothetical protein
LPLRGPLGSLPAPSPSPSSSSLPRPPWARLRPGVPPRCGDRGFALLHRAVLLPCVGCSLRLDLGSSAGLSWAASCPLGWLASAASLVAAAGLGCSPLSRHDGGGWRGAPRLLCSQTLGGHFCLPLRQPRRALLSMGPPSWEVVAVRVLGCSCSAVVSVQLPLCRLGSLPGSSVALAERGRAKNKQNKHIFLRCPEPSF